MALRFALLLLVVSSNAIAQSSELCNQTGALIKTLQRFHYSPLDLDNQVHERNLAINTLLTLDDSRLTFLAEDITTFSQLSSGLLDTNQNSGCTFVSELADIYMRREQTSDSLFNEVLRKPLKLRNGEFVTLRFDSIEGFATSRAELHRKIESTLNLAALSEYYNVYAEFDSITGKERTSFDDFETEIRERALDRFNCDNGVEAGALNRFIGEILLNELALLYDPHTAYFSPVERQRFQTRLSSEQKSFGILFGEDDQGNAVVEEVIPGSSAWHSGKIYEGDMLKRVVSAAGAEIIVTCLGGHEIVDKIDQGPDDILLFHVRHPDGAVETVRLKRGAISVDENMVRGFVLDGEKKVGYVALPSFYTDWTSVDGLGCSNDLAREILNLKKEGIEGLILDLRYNGGGSVKEALELAGLFINEGTVLIKTARDDKPRLSKDPNRGVVYSDPLMVMVNGFSASASEIVAAALQDYNRALIIGSVTYGKSTAQTILPLLSASGRSFSNGETGYVKVTQSVIHRITGESHQAVGVVPDILLPDPYAGLYDREADQPTAISVPFTDKKTYAVPLSPLPSQELKDKSESRQEGKPHVMDMMELNSNLKALYQIKGLTLSDEAIKSYAEKLEKVREQLERTTTNKTELFEVVQHGYNQNLARFDDFEKQASNQSQQETNEDVFIQEAYQVMIHWLSLTN